MESTPAELITCDLCGKETNASGEDTLIFGEWMRRTQLTVHYFCLLLSTNLPQRGKDTSGIKGFLVRDIRKEVEAARKRICFYCEIPGASIKCETCGKYFHLVCSVENRCTLQFSGQYHCYCSTCPPMDEYRQQLVDHPPQGVTCDICMGPIILFELHNVVFPGCCRLGFVHKNCMLQYAVSSGYYLSCIWCRSSEFRDTVRMQGIFVPDHDAVWERETHAYRELHRRTLLCDEAECLSSNGRSYNKNTWHIIACHLCGSAGAHARCLARSVQQRKGPEPIEFKCTLCQEVEKKLAEREGRRLSIPSLETNTEDHVNTSFFVTKNGPQLPASGHISENDEDSSSNDSVITVIPNYRRTTECFTAPSNDLTGAIVSPPQVEAIHLTDSPPKAETIDLTDSLPQAETVHLTDSPPQAEAIDLRDLPSQPQQLLELRESFNCPGEPFFYLVVYEFDEHGKCKGSCTLRFNDQDPRIKDRSEEALMRVQVLPEDVWFRNKDCGVFGIVDKYRDKRQN